MCLLIFIRISVATLCGRQMKSCNFTKILEVRKIKISLSPSIDKIFYYFAPLGFGIAEYNGGGGGCGVCPVKWTQIPENEVLCPGSVWKNYGMYGGKELTIFQTIKY